MRFDLNELLISQLDDNPKAPFPSASESDIEEFEKLVNAKLPDDYRQFLLTINGGTPDRNQVPGGLSYEIKPFLPDFKYETTRTNLDYLLSLNTSFFESVAPSRIAHSMVWQYQVFRELEMYDDFVPPDCVPIAHGHATSVNLLLVLDGPHKNKVFWYDHDIEATKLYENVWLVADSFMAFAEGLGPGD